MIATAQLFKAMQGHALISDLEAHQIQMLAALAHSVEFLPGEIVFREGEQANWFYYLVSGEVELELKVSGGPLPIQVVHGGQELGWSSLFGESKKHFTARALTRVEALAFDGSELRLAFRQDPDFGYRFMRRLLAVASERLDATRMELVRSNEESRSAAFAQN